jgi:hypothetical protein
MCSIGLSMYYLSDTLLEITISHILIFSLLAFLFRPKNFFSKTQYLLIQSNLKALLQKKHD